MPSSLPKSLLKGVLADDYPQGFVTPLDYTCAPQGLCASTIRFISAQKKEPSWLLAWRLKAFDHWRTLTPPRWANLHYPPIDFQALCYYAAPKQAKYKRLEEVDPAIRKTFERLGIPLTEQKKLAGVAVDAVLDSTSVATTFQKTLKEKGIIFCAFGEAVQQMPELVRRYLGKVVPMTDNYFAALNAAVFSDGSFCYLPKGVRCPMELSTYFRINAANTGQFERTLIIAEEGSYVSYLEGCTAPMREAHQLHAAVVEIHAQADAQVRYATIQNWYPGDAKGKGGVYNFVTKRGLCAGDRAKISWTQLETGSAITWKYPSCILKGAKSIGEFYSVAITKHHQQADTGSKMIHLGKGSRSRIVAKGISAGKSKNSYRGLVKITKAAQESHHYSQCDALLLGDRCGSYTFPYIEVHNSSSTLAHEASTSKVAEAQLFYLQQRGLNEAQAHALIVTGFCQEVLARLPMEFALEARQLLSITLEGSVG